MDTKNLESFALVVEHGSVAEAARRLSITSTAVAQRMRALEREVGARLVTRSGRTVRPTESGWSILEPARTILAATRDLRSLANTKNFAGELRLGAISSALTGILPPVLSKLDKAYPLLNLFLHPGMSTELYDKVIDGTLDAAVIVEPEFDLSKSCDWTTWREEALIVLAHRGIKSGDANAILACEPFIRYDRKQWGGRLAEDYLQCQGIRPRDRYELDSLDAIAVLVSRRLGVSLVPDWATPWPEGLSLRKVALSVKTHTRRIGVVWQRGSPRSRLIQALLAVR